MKRSNLMAIYVLFFLNFSILSFGQVNPTYHLPDRAVLNSPLSLAELKEINKNLLEFAQHRLQDGNLHPSERSLISTLIIPTLSAPDELSGFSTGKSEHHKRIAKQAVKANEYLFRRVLLHIVDLLEIVSSASDRLARGVTDKDLELAIKHAREAMPAILQSFPDHLQESIKKPFDDSLAEAQKKISEGSSLTEEKRGDAFLSLLIMPKVLSAFLFQIEINEINTRQNLLKKDYYNLEFAEPLKDFLENESGYQNNFEICRLKKIVYSKQSHYIILMAKKEAGPSGQTPKMSKKQRVGHYFNSVKKTFKLLLGFASLSDRPSLKNVKTLTEKNPVAAPVISEQIEVQPSEFTEIKKQLQKEGFIEIPPFSAADVGPDFVRMFEYSAD